MPRHLTELRERLRGSFMVRRLKEHVADELPPRTWSVVPLAETREVREALRHPAWVEVQHLWEMDPDAFDALAPVDGHIAEARRILGEAKAPGVAAYCRELLDGGVEQLVVGAWHLSVLWILKKELECYGLAYMDGSTPARKRQAAVDAFQRGEARVILGQMQPLGEGWTLAAAQDVVFAEPHWVPGRNDQLLDRVHRIGQVGGPVTGHLLVAAGSLDERVMSRAVSKAVAVREALDGRADR